MSSIHPAILKTQAWLEQVIIGLNFCPFAKKEFVNNTIDYHVCAQRKLEQALETVIARCHYLQQHDEIETSLVIFSLGFRDFEDYLDLVDYANQLLVDSGFEGVFQLASFHPEYCFEGESPLDAANYTNRSPLPTLHIIREDSLARVLAVYQNPEQIPDNNIALAQDKGNNFFKQLLANIHQKHE
ncbi:DUF1415 domain-containing protein [Thalassotalea sp. PLHSN55]|uniref:DUF1415 domain-containing protein n=1 Tax=Thalassotalea sp. PLHSN55 TaxID=3435888 RepID=UPI003F827ADB